MCGLVSVVSKFTNGFTQKQKDIFSTLLFIDTLRGDDSTGMFLMDNLGSLHLSKEASEAQKFMTHPDYDAMMRKAITNGSILVGHNRKATKGVISDENAHPFLVDDKICLVHNGTLWGDHKQHADVEVDSHAIAHLIAKDGPDKAINTINGAFALIWHNFEDNTVSFVRNSQRPLYWAETDNEWIWSSEAEMIEFACTRNGVVLKAPPVQLKEHIICQFKLNLEDKTLTLTNIPIVPETKTYTSDNSKSSWGYGGYTYGDECGYGYGYQKHRPYYESKYERASIEYVGKDISSKRAALLVSGVGDTAVTQLEMEECTMQANLINADEFREVIQKYPYKTRVTAFSYNATCVNETDDSDGMFLWCSIPSDPSVVIRYRYKPGEVTKDYLEEVAKAGLYYSCVIDHKAWQRVNGYMSKGMHTGFAIFTASEIDMCEKPTVENMQKKEEVSV